MTKGFFCGKKGHKKNQCFKNHNNLYYRGGKSGSDIKPQRDGSGRGKGYSSNRAGHKADSGYITLISHSAAAKSSTPSTVKDFL